MRVDPLSSTFAALADPTRRAILARLTGGAATVNDLAAPFAISLPAISRHLKVLENAKLIEQGTHAELMQVDGRYAELFNLQAESYLEPLPAAEFAPAPGPEWMRVSA